MNIVEFASHVWDTLSKIDVTDHVEYMGTRDGKPGFRYLPWHKAWNLTKKVLPATTYRHEEDVIHEDGTMEVEVVVRFRNPDPSPQCPDHFESCTLAVMDYNYNAIVGPNARQINDARQRALTKALAFAGLGLNLWGDSDVPAGHIGEPISDDQLADLTALIEETNSNLDNFLEWAGVTDLKDVPIERYAEGVAMLRHKLKAKEKSK